MIMPVWWCGRHRPVCRECAWRLPYWYKRMCEWVRMVLRERFYTGFVFCFAIFCCQNFLLWKCIFMHSVIAFRVGGTHCAGVSLRRRDAMGWGMPAGKSWCSERPDCWCDCGWILPSLRCVALTAVVYGRDMMRFYSDLCFDYQSFVVWEYGVGMPVETQDFASPVWFMSWQLIVCSVTVWCEVACRDARFCVSRMFYMLTVNGLKCDSLVWSCL